MPMSDTDIIERLRWQKRYTKGIVPVTMEDAAKEIERLRAALSWIENLDPPLGEAARERFLGSGQTPPPPSRGRQRGVAWGKGSIPNVVCYLLRCRTRHITLSFCFS
jgi:hypothetical protein